MAALVVVLVAAACGDDDSESTSAPDGSEPAQEEQPVAGGELTWLQTTEVATMDPTMGTAAAGQMGTRLAAVYGALVTYRSDTLEAEPWLAESLEPNGDFTEWTLKLRPDLVFSDGTVFDAEAVHVNWARAQDPAVNRSQSLPIAKTITEFVVEDPTTLRVKLSAPNAHFDAEVSRVGLNYIASPAAIAGGNLANEPVGAGPFMVENWIRDDRMVLVRNPTYFDAPRPYLDRLTVRVVPSEEQRVDTFVTGGADAYFSFQPDSINRASDDSGGAAYIVQVPDAIMLLPNTKAPPFDDVRVRRAIALAVDRAALNQAASIGSTPADNFTVEGTPWYTPDAALPPFDPDEAQSLIDEYVAEKGGPISFNIVASQTNPAIAKFVQTSLDQLNDIQASVEVLDGPTFFGRVVKGDFQFAANWGMPWLNPDVNVGQFFITGGGLNYAGYSNARVDELIKESKATDDLDARTEAYHEVFATVAEDLPGIPVVHGGYGFAFAGDIRDVQLYEDGIPRWDLLWRAG